jgi:hypothetical protein
MRMNEPRTGPWITDLTVSNGGGWMEAATGAAIVVVLRPFLESRARVTVRDLTLRRLVAYF